MRVVASKSVVARLCHHGTLMMFCIALLRECPLLLLHWLKRRSELTEARGRTPVAGVEWETTRRLVRQGEVP